jgi:CHAT domain-containing protein
MYKAAVDPPNTPPQADSPAASPPALLEQAWTIVRYEFDVLSADEQAKLLQALVDEAVDIYLRDGDPLGWTKQLAFFDRAIELGEERFEALNDKGKAQVVRALVNAGATHQQFNSSLSGWSEALDRYTRAASLGEPLFELNEVVQTRVLQALTEAGFTHEQLDDSPPGWAKALGYYERVVKLGEPLFDSIDVGGKFFVLKALTKAGFTNHQLDDSPPGWAKALVCYERVAALGEPLFDSLNNVAKALVLQALNAAADLLDRLDDSPSRWVKALDCYRRAATMGETIFASLDDLGKESVVLALVFAGETHKQLDASPSGLLQELDGYERAVSLGEPLFNSLNGFGKQLVLQALSAVGFKHKHLDDSPSGLVKELDCYERSIVLFEHYPMVDSVSMEAALMSVDLLESGLYNLRQPPSSALPLGIVLLPWTEIQGRVDNARIRAQVPIRNRVADGPGADRWLTRAKAFPADVHKPEQANTVRRLAQARLAIHAQSRELSALGQSGQQERLVSSIAKRIAQSRGWPLQCESLAHWLLALLSVHAPQLVAMPASRRWQDSRWSPDVPAIAQVLRFEAMRFEDGSFRAPHYWGRLLAHFELAGIRYNQDPQDTVQASQWMGDWLDRSDGKALSEALQLQWLNLNMPTQELAQWLGEQRMENALVVASLACWGGQSERAVAQALQRDSHAFGLGRAHHSQLNHRLTELAKAHEGREATEWALAETLQRFAHGGLSQPGLSAEQIWELLESSRLGLASKAHPSKCRWSEWDEVAVQAIHAAELRAVDEAELHIKVRQAGKPLPTPDQVEGSLEPFTSMAQQWQRMGVGLVFETPASAAALLHPAESLVQLWWAEAEQDPGGAGQVLWLRKTRAGQSDAAFELQHLTLPQQLDRSAIQQMLQPWTEQGRMDRLGSEDKTGVVQATQEAWDSLMVPGSAARQLLQWLARAGDAQLTLILSHDLSNLPWQALHEQLQQEQPPAPAAMTIQLAPSVSTWAQARRVSKEVKSASAKTLKASVVMAHDIFSQGGQLQAQRVSEILGVKPRVSDDLHDVIKALEHDDVVHLAHHGQYDAQAPQRSKLLVVARDGYASAQLPAWVLAQLSLHADVSLATCEALQSGVGESHAAALGPLGIGPMLMSAGARSVAGSLWQCDAWAAAVFFALWYDQRRSQEAAIALQHARQRLRRLSYEQFLQWVQKVAPEALPGARQRCDATRHLWARPFEHPWCWATFALLGNAPALPALRPTSLPDQSPSKAASWMSWFVQLWQRALG